jgi:NDP-sugar pyrophosphorylase family protein
MGTGGALKLAEARLADAFVLANGDTWIPLDYGALVAAWARRKPDAMVVAHSGDGVDVPRNLVVAPDGAVLAYEKRSPPRPDANAVDAGTGVFRREILRHVPPGAKCDLEPTVYPHLVARGQIDAWWTGTKFYDIGTPSRLDTIRRHLESLA